MCTNNTIEGTQWSDMPETGAVPLVADMSSDIASRPIDVKQFGLIFAGAQKNLGPSGVTVVIIRRDLAERGNDKIAKILAIPHAHQGKVALSHAADLSRFTSSDWCWSGSKREGGVAAIEKRNDAKAKLLYDAIDASGLLHVPGREGVALEDERRVPRGGRRRSDREEIREGSRGGGSSASRATARSAGCARRSTTP